MSVAPTPTLSLLLAACSHEGPTISGSLSQRGYLWQRSSNPWVEVALAEARQLLNGIILLGAQINRRGDAPQIVWAGLWVKDSDEKFGDRWYETLAARAAQTGIGRAVATHHWFVDRTAPWSEGQKQNETAMRAALHIPGP